MQGLGLGLGRRGLQVILQTDTAENITFQETTFAGGKNEALMETHAVQRVGNSENSVWSVYIFVNYYPFTARR